MWQSGFQDIKGHMTRVACLPTHDSLRLRSCWRRNLPPPVLSFCLAAGIPSFFSNCSFTSLTVVVDLTIKATVLIPERVNISTKIWNSGSCSCSVASSSSAVPFCSIVSIVSAACSESSVPPCTNESFCSSWSLCWQSLASCSWPLSKYLYGAL